MTGGRVLVGEALLTGTGLEAARLHRRAALLSRTGGGTLISPVVGDERVLSPGVRHVPVRVAPGLTHENLVAEVADAVGALLDAARPKLVHCMGVSSGVPAVLRRRPGARVVIEPGILPSQWLRDHQPKLPAERLLDMVSVEDKTLARADAVIARSMIEAATLVQRGVPHEKVYTSPDGVPIGVQTGAAPDLPHVLWLGDMAPWSGWAVPMDALARLKRPWRLTLVTPPDAPAGQMEAHARALRVSDRVTVSRDDSMENIISRLDAASVVVCSMLHTRCTETGGVIPESVLWALAAGRAIVASDLPVVRTYAGAAARYFPPGDAGTLATQLEALLGSPDARDTLVEHGVRTAAALDWAETERTIADVWAEVPGD